MITCRCDRCRKVEETNDGRLEGWSVKRPDPDGLLYFELLCPECTAEVLAEAAAAA